MRNRENGYTLIEVFLCIVIISILAAIGIPHISNDKLKAYNTTRKIAVALRYTRSLAIGSAIKHKLVFDPSGGPYTSYRIQRWNKSNNTWEPQGDARQIPAGVVCNGTREITFEYLGNALNNGAPSDAVVSVGPNSVTVAAMTGRVSGE